MAKQQGLSNSFTGQDTHMTFKEQQDFQRNRSLNRFIGDTPMFDTTNKGLILPVTLKNRDTISHKITIFPGGLISVDEIKDVTGLSVDAIAKHGETITDKVECSCETLRFAQAFVNRNPTMISEMQISVSEHSQLSQPIDIRKAHPCRQLGSTSIIPETYQRPSDSITNLVRVILPDLQLDDQTVFSVTLLPNSQMNITFYFGMTRSDAYLLSESVRVLQA